MPSEAGAQCPSCSSQIPRPEQFCPACGARLPLVLGAAPRSGNDRPPNRWAHWVPPIVVVCGLLILGLMNSRPDSAVPTDTSGGRLVATPRSAIVEVEYRLTGSASGADITYTDGSGNIQQQTGIAVPLVRESSGDPGIQFRVERGSFVTFSAQNTGPSGDLDCEIRADGRVVNSGHSSGGYAIVSCSAEVP
jgi:hypothetical protein